MDAERFDALLRTLASAPSRRDVVRGVAGLVGTRALYSLGWGGAAEAKKLKTGACLPAGTRCDTKRHDPPCTKCCSGIVAKKKSGKKKKKKCGCKAVSAACTGAAQCCTSACGDGQCRPAPCASIGESCTELDCCTGFCGDGICRSAACQQVGLQCEAASDCCSGACDVTLPEPSVCVTCLPLNAPCRPGNNLCCSSLSCQAGTCQP